MSLQFRDETLPENCVPIIAIDVPVIYEDEGQEEMGESIPHVTTDRTLLFGLLVHFQDQPEFQVLSNLNMYYHRIDKSAYVSPDEMVVQVDKRLQNLGGYRVGVDGPAPLVAIEILSKRSFQQQDLSNKPTIYAMLGVLEYILIDTTGVFLEQRVLLRHLQPDGSWLDQQDNDGGITSRLGFRLQIEADGKLRVSHALTGRKYSRQEETELVRRELEQQAHIEKQRAEAEKQRAEAEKQRAEAEKQRADSEKQRAELLQIHLEEAQQRAALEVQNRSDIEAELERLKALLFEKESNR